MNYIPLKHILQFYHDEEIQNHKKEAERLHVNFEDYMRFIFEKDCNPRIEGWYREE